MAALDNPLDNPLDETTLSTLNLLESRMLRVEHLLYGRATTPSPTQHDSAARRLGQLERRFSLMLSEFRVYGELLKIYKAHPDFFHSPAPGLPPSQLAPDAIRAIVLASASSYSATLSALTAITDSPVPDPAESAALIALSGRMKAVEATQVAQADEMAQLRRRSEALIRRWYEASLLQSSQGLADVEGRVERVERRVRRAEHERRMEEEEV